MTRDEIINRLPPELKAIVKGGPKLIAPDPATLKAISDAGPGEHQNRLWTLACKHSIEQFWNRIQFAVEQHEPELKGLMQEIFGGPFGSKLGSDGKVVN